MSKRTFNPLVEGSNPSRPTSKIKGFRHLRPEALFCFSSNLLNSCRSCDQNAITVFVAILIVAFLVAPTHAADPWSKQDIALFREENYELSYL